MILFSFLYYLLIIFIKYVAISGSVKVSLFSKYNGMPEKYATRQLVVNKITC